jgi:hypothetical protein
MILRRGKKRTLKVLASVEVLLLLEQESITGYGNTTDSLAVSRIWERDAFIVGEVGTVVFPHPALLDSRHLGDNCSWALIGALEEGCSLHRTRISTHSTDCLLNCLKGVHVIHCGVIVNSPLVEL